MINGRSILIIMATLLFLALNSSPAISKDWKIDYPNSRISFIGQQGDSKFTGTFQKFTLAVDFDPKNPTTGKIEATIDTGSAVTGDKDRDSWLPQADWFNVNTFPQATFVSTNIQKTDNDYVAYGKLTIKDIARPVTLKFSMTPQGTQTKIQGTASLIRTDFNVGANDWANENYVKFGVDIIIDLQAQPAP